ncbi:hypothetical protein AURDEDRAFT_77498, partial [Auricularia subglabra TFB-10046 SS5]
MSTDLSVVTSSQKLVSTIPRLLPGGTNWVTYKERMLQYLLGQPGFRKHLTGRAKEPKAVAAYELQLDAYEDLMDDWVQKQAAIASVLTSSWPEDIQHLFIHITPVSARWKALVAQFEDQSVLSKSDLLIQLLDIRCTGLDDEDVLDKSESHASEEHAYLTVATEHALRAAGRQTLRLLDTGASQHYDGDLANFTEIADCEPFEITTASG